VKIRILAIGRAQSAPAAELYADYANRIDRIGPGLGFRGFELRDWAESKAARAPGRKSAEAALLLGAANGGPLVALDEGGEDLSSTDFAVFIARARDEGASALDFVIGGPDGLDETVRKAARKTFRFGRQTWPHLLVRAMLAEQIYRAMTILAGHPYHRG
jgi:23S rRNA (pseudouridine1915-N3)-methyltransferase